MNTTTKIVLAGIVGLVMGVGGTMAFAQRNDSKMADHVMSDGSLMKGGMQEEMNSMMASLQGKTGDEFDRTFLEEMILHHQGAVQMAEAALINAKHQEIKDLAEDIITAQKAEIKEMQDWQMAWYGVQPIPGDSNQSGGATHHSQ